MGLRISQLLEPSRVVLDLRAAKRSTAIHEVSRQLEGLPQVTNFPAFYAELLARERLDSTCIGYEVAVPHARTEHITELIMAAGRLREPVAFERDKQAVRLVFVLATPKSRAGDYLQALGGLCRLLKSDEVRLGLLSAETGEAFIQVLAEAEIRPAVVR